MSIAVDLAVIWAFIIAFAVFVYVVMDGFDLGARHPVSAVSQESTTATSS